MPLILGFKEIKQMEEITPAEVLRQRTLTLTNSPTLSPKVSDSSRALFAYRFSDGPPVQLTPEEAWIGGTNIQTAIRYEPQLTRAFLVSELGSLCKIVSAGTTISDSQEMAEVVRALIEEFPTFKLEEFTSVFKLISRGKWKLFNRLKLDTLMDCCKDWEKTRAETILERSHRPDYDPFERTSDKLAKEKKEWISLTEQDLIDLGQIKPKQ